MNTISKSLIKKGEPLLVSRDPAPLAGYPLNYPIHEVKSLSYRGKLRKIGAYDHLDLDLESSLLVEDAVDATLFEYPLSLTESLDLLKEEDEVGEGYIVPGSSFDLDALSLRIIEGALPLRLTHPGPSKLSPELSSLVKSEEEAAKEKEQRGDPRWDKLADLEVDK